MTWNPSDYLRFIDERTRPAANLVSRIAMDAPERIVDLGCGPGNSTRVLRQRWHKAEITGIDSSAEMIAAAKEALPDVTFTVGDIGAWRADAPVNLLFSNAALHWLPDHGTLVTRLFDQVAPGGVFAFQIPSAVESPVRAHMREVATMAPWGDWVAAHDQPLTMEHPHVYYDVLAPRAKAVDLWETEYIHVMDSAADIVSWFAGTSLRPILDALATSTERMRFKELLAERVAKSYPVRADGKVLFPFRRTFVVAYRR